MTARLKTGKQQPRAHQAAFWHCSNRFCMNNALGIEFCNRFFMSNAQPKLMKARNIADLAAGNNHKSITVSAFREQTKKRNAELQIRVSSMRMQRQLWSKAYLLPLASGAGVGVTDVGMVSSQCSKLQCWKRWVSKDGGPEARAVVMMSVTRRCRMELKG